MATISAPLVWRRLWVQWRAALGKLHGIEHGKDPPESVMAGDAIGQGEKAAQKLDLGVAEFLKVHKAFGPAEHRAKRDGEDVDERVVFGAVDSRIFDDGEVKNETLRMGLLGHPQFLSDQVRFVQIIVSTTRHGI